MSEWSRDVLLSIFQHLDCQSFFCAFQVCKRWNAILKEEQVNQSSWFKSVSEQMLREMDDCCWEARSAAKNWTPSDVYYEKMDFYRFHSIYTRLRHVSFSKRMSMSRCNNCKQSLYFDYLIQIKTFCPNLLCLLKESFYNLNQEKQNRKMRESKIK